MDSPITANIRAAAATHPLILFDSIRHTVDSTRRAPDRRAGSGVVTEVDQPGEDAAG
ncbi:MAG TPA: hypothetical protein VGJ07_01640 [Rugosimonospora sp.]|jgi:hypothetical protein